MISRICDRMDEAVNPVLLRDLRLYGRGRGFLGAYFLILVVLVIAGVTYALAARWGGMDGAGLLYVPTALIAIIVGALVPNMVGERFRAELSSRSSELALASPLTAGRLVRGKVYGAWILSAVVVSTAAPVFATAYLLGGVTLAGILCVAAGLALAGLVMPLPQLYLATKARKPGGGRVLAALLFVGSASLMWGYASLLHFAFAGARAHAALESRFAFYAFATAGLLYAQFLYFVTVSRLRPAALDRELRPRLALAFGAVAGGVVAFLLMRSPALGLFGGRLSGEFLTAAAVVIGFAFCLGMEILSHDNGAEPLRAVDDGRGALSRALFSTGLASLSLYFILFGGAVLACGLCPYLLSDAGSRRLAPLLLCPFLIHAIGLAAYSWLIRPFIRKQYAATTLPNAITAVNVVIAVIAAFALVLVNELPVGDFTKALVYGGNPLGLVVSMSAQPDEIERAVTVASALLLFLSAAQIPVILRLRRAGAPAR